MTGSTLTHASAILAGACAVFALLLDRRTRRRAADHALAEAKHRADAAFVQWARWTFVSITDVEGALFYRSLYDLRHEPADLIWAYPRSAILFQAGPEEPDPYHHQEATRG